ncbi:MAG: hypothetical protein M0D55_11860 [Elusimicrobiota bacterium]|nr:MAG: hypothetical protein M0D55_11860 [Elusimicrobiota bacterium]
MRAALAALLLAAAGTARAQDPAEPAPQVSTAAAGERVAEIRIERVNVFDPTVPGEDWWPFRVANRIHVPTRESVIRREILFAPGEVWDPLKVIQSERNLRTNGAFRRVDILPVKRPDGQVDAVVRSQDSWTTNPRFAAGTEGGETFFSMGVEEGNILGYGKSVAFDYGRSNGRTASSYSYGDPRFLGTRLGLNGSYSKGSTGDASALSLTRPFYALEAHGASAASWRRYSDEFTIQREAADFSKHRKSRRTAEASVGRRVSEDPALVQRVEAGWYADRLQYEPMKETAPGFLPAGRELSGPTFGYTLIQANYIKETYIDRMERVEDFNLGNEFSARAGWMGERTGSDRDRMIWNVSNQHGVRFAPGRFAIARAALQGRTAGGRWENGLANVDLNMFWKTNWRGDHTLVAHAEGAFGRFLDKDSQVILGGATGLRGYKNNSFTGGKAVLVNFEDRFFFPGEYLHLVRLGAAVFVDSGFVADEGRTWPCGGSSPTSASACGRRPRAGAAEASPA